MRKHNIAQDLEASRLNSIELMKEDTRIKYVIYGAVTLDNKTEAYTYLLNFKDDEFFNEYMDYIKNKYT